MAKIRVVNIYGSYSCSISKYNSLTGAYVYEAGLASSTAGSDSYTIPSGTESVNRKVTVTFNVDSQKYTWKCINYWYPGLDETKQTSSKIYNSNAFNFSTSTSATANFYVSAEEIKYTITLASNYTDSDWISLTGGGSFNYGDTTTITASLLQGGKYAWDNKWTNGSTTKTGQSFNLTVSKTEKWTAYFKKISYSISASSGGNGSVTASVSSACYGDTVKFTAKGSTGYELDHFEINGSEVSGGSPLSWTVTGNTSCKGIFSKIKYSITGVASPPEAGRVTGGGNVPYLESTELTAEVTDDTYYFDRWNTGYKETTLSVDKVTSAKTYTAYFKKKPYVSGVPNDPTRGTVSGSKYVEYNGDCTLTATPYTGYYLKSWSNGWSEEELTVSNVTSDRSFTANFQPYVYKVYYDVVTNGGEWTIDHKESFSKTYGTSFEVQTTAPYKKGYKFLGWDKDPTSSTASISPGAACNDSQCGYVKDQDSTIYAIFAPIEHKIIRSYYKIDGSGPFTYSNKSVNIETANPYYVFAPDYDGEYTPGGDWIFYGWYSSGTTAVEPSGWKDAKGIFYDVDQVPSPSEVPFEITEGYPSGIDWDDPECKIYLYGSWTITGKSVKIDGTWRKCVAYVKVAGHWRPVVDSANGTGMKVKINGHWYWEVGKLPKGS